MGKNKRKREKNETDAIKFFVMSIFTSKSLKRYTKLDLCVRAILTANAGSFRVKKQYDFVHVFYKQYGGALEGQKSVLSCGFRSNTSRVHERRTLRSRFSSRTYN